MTKILEKQCDSRKVLSLLYWACYKSKHTCNREERKLSNYTHERYLEWASQSSSNKVLGLAHFMKHNLNWVFVFFIILCWVVFCLDLMEENWCCRYVDCEGTSSNTSCLEAGFSDCLFDPYILWPFDKKLIS